MNYTIHLHPEAEEQLLHMAHYLEDQRSGLGSVFMREFNETLDYLEKYAHSQLIKRKTFRQIIIGRFRVLAVYQVSATQVTIYNIIHTSREPAKRYRKK